MDAFLALICIFGGSFAPKNWALCWGQIMAISQNSALFSLIGTTYAGDGQTTFGLPDLRGRAPIGTGAAPGGNNYQWGQTGGALTVALDITNLPSHTHPVDSNLVVTPTATTTAGTSAIPGPTLAPAVLPTIGGGPSATPLKGYGVANGSTTLAPATATGFVGFAGNNVPINVQNPYLAVNYIISLLGIFPSRN